MSVRQSNVLTAYPGCRPNTHHRHIVEVHRKRQEALDGCQPVVGMPYYNRLPRKQPVKLVGKASIVPAALPPHDLGGVDQQVPIKADKERSVGADDVRQVAAPRVQDGSGTIPVALVPCDVPHEGILPGGTGVVGKVGIIAALWAPVEDGMWTFHLILDAMEYDEHIATQMMIFEIQQECRVKNWGRKKYYGVEVGVVSFLTSLLENLSVVKFTKADFHGSVPFCTPRRMRSKSSCVCQMPG